MKPIPEPTIRHSSAHLCYDAEGLNQCLVLSDIFTNMSITGTSMSTPTTVARAAPEDNPKSIVEVAIATSK